MTASEVSTVMNPFHRWDDGGSGTFGHSSKSPQLIGGSRGVRTLTLKLDFSLGAVLAEYTESASEDRAQHWEQHFS